MNSQMVPSRAETTAEALLELLSLRGIDCFFANAGTDFASPIEGFARKRALGEPHPRPLGVAHEVPLIAMAYGYYCATGRAQAAMVHVGVGTAHALGPIMSASRARIPILFFAGRTPLTEYGDTTSRNVHIHWAQESFDQASVIREYVKWDYELKDPRQLEDVVDRALGIAMSDPKGPVYVTLPREILGTPSAYESFHKERRYDPQTLHPDPEKIRTAASMIARAKNPYVITSSLGESPSAVEALVNRAESHGIGVVSFNPEYMNFPADHFCHQGFSPDAILDDADLLIVLESDVPWIPNRKQPNEGTTIIHAGIDPLYARYPLRSFPSDLTVAGNAEAFIRGLGSALEELPNKNPEEIEQRRHRLRLRHESILNRVSELTSESESARPLQPHLVSHSLREVFGRDAVVFNEYDNAMESFSGAVPGTYFGSPHAGYLGWGMGAALGFKMAEPEKAVIAAVGDGSYIFGVPTACHLAASAYDLPIITIIYNNRGWAAVKRAVRAVHPGGWAERKNDFVLSDLEPSPDFEKICLAFGGHGEKITDPDDVVPALERARDLAAKDRRQVVLNMVCAKP